VRTLAEEAQALIGGTATPEALIGGTTAAEAQRPTTGRRALAAAEEEVGEPAAAAEEAVAEEEAAAEGAGAEEEAA
jgi:hypothetical protein